MDTTSKYGVWVNYWTNSKGIKFFLFLELDKENVSLFSDYKRNELQI
jgi:hypothetical protein